jgi:hypothetical protein
MADLLINGQPTLTTTGTSGMTAPVAGTSESWTCVPLSTLWPAVTAPDVVRLVDPNWPGEIIAVTAAAGAADEGVTVTRGVEGTTPVVHKAGAVFDASVITKATFDEKASVGTINGGTP